MSANVSWISIGNRLSRGRRGKRKRLNSFTTYTYTMRRINVTVSDESGEILDRYKASQKSRSLDTALDNLLKEFDNGKKIGSQRN